MTSERKLSKHAPAKTCSNFLSKGWWVISLERWCTSLRIHHQHIIIITLDPAHFLSFFLLLKSSHRSLLSLLFLSYDVCIFTHNISTNIARTIILHPSLKNLAVIKLLIYIKDRSGLFDDFIWNGFNPKEVKLVYEYVVQKMKKWMYVNLKPGYSITI